jgi:hypothetical protein
MENNLRMSPLPKLGSVYSTTELRPVVVSNCKQKSIVLTAISILGAPPFCHGSARSCSTTRFLNNFGFAEYHQVGDITAYKGVCRYRCDTVMLTKKLLLPDFKRWCHKMNSHSFTSGTRVREWWDPC